MIWISPDVPPEGTDVEKLLEGVDHRSPVKIDQGRRLLQWFSICSKHYWHEPTCHLCRSGYWKQIKPPTDQGHQEEDA